MAAVLRRWRAAASALVIVYLCHVIHFTCARDEPARSRPPGMLSMIVHFFPFQPRCVAKADLQIHEQ